MLYTIFKWAKLHLSDGSFDTNIPDFTQTAESHKFSNVQVQTRSSIPLSLNWSGIVISAQRFVSSIFGATHFCAETILISLLWQKFWIWYSQLNWSRMKYNCKAVTNAVLIKIYGILSFSLAAIICVVSKQRHWFQPTFFVLQWHIICFQSKPIQTNPIQSNSTLYEIICFWKKHRKFKMGWNLWQKKQFFE